MVLATVFKAGPNGHLGVGTVPRRRGLLIPRRGQTPNVRPSREQLPDDGDSSTSQHRGLHDDSRAVPEIHFRRRQGLDVTTTSEVSLWHDTPKVSAVLDDVTTTAELQQSNDEQHKASRNHGQVIGDDGGSSLMATLDSSVDGRVSAAGLTATTTRQG